MLGTERKEYLFNELTKLIGPVGLPGNYQGLDT